MADGMGLDGPGDKTTLREERSKIDDDRGDVSVDVAARNTLQTRS